ncbi:MAG: hypothetical protein Q4E89_06350 [Eubacteriales bacterium]|nr:hypothetical protein [Eubacteriales bacterium]
MAKSSNQKMKILFLLRLFQEEREETPVYPMQTLVELLAAEGISAERKSIYDDLEVLRQFGLDIRFRKERPSGYYLVRDQEAPKTGFRAAALDRDRQEQRTEPAVQDEPTAEPGAEKILDVKPGDTSGSEREEQRADKGACKAEEAVQVKEESSPSEEKEKSSSVPEADFEPENSYELEGDSKAESESEPEPEEDSKPENDSKPDNGKAVLSIFRRRIPDRPETCFFSRSPWEKEDMAKTFKLLCNERGKETALRLFGNSAFCKKKSPGWYVVSVDIVPGSSFYGWLTSVGTDIHIQKPRKEAIAYRDYLKTIIKDYKNLEK